MILRNLFAGRRIKKLKVLFCFFIYLITFSLSHSITSAFAAEMKSGQYRLNTGSYNISNDKINTDNKTWQKVSTDSALGFTDTGFISHIGFPYTKTVLPFGLAISNTTFDFGGITMGGKPNPLPASTLSVAAAGAAGFQVLASQNHPLTIIKGSTTIADTTCDNPDDTCSETIAKPWTDNSQYGFGYNLSGQDIPKDFLGPTYFRHFSDESNQEEPAVVMSSINPDRTSEATITYKVLVPAIQASGIYDNVVTFLAVPGY